MHLTTFKAVKRRSWPYVLAFVCVCLLNTQAFADCHDDSDKPDCVYVPPGESVKIQPSAFKFPANDPTPTCAIVTNQCTPLDSDPQPEVMVPDKTEDEWKSFLYKHENCAKVETCSCASGYTLQNNVCVPIPNCSLTPGELWNGLTCVQACPNLYGSNTVYPNGVMITGTETGFNSPTCAYGTASDWITIPTLGRGIPTAWTCSSDTQTPAVCAFGTKCEMGNFQGCQ